MGKRLLSFADVNNKQGRVCVEKHLVCIRQYKERKTHASKSG
jgi:hypothetical protein